MPEVFSNLQSFESWFDFSELKDKDGYEQIFTEERKQTLVSSLHAILKPFLLRRVKADVEKLLPKKREYVLFAPLTDLQRDLYQSILEGSSRAFLEDKMVDSLTSGTATPTSSSGRSLKRKILTGLETPNKSARTSRDSTPASSIRGTRSARRRNYTELTDTQFFAKMDDSSENTPSDGSDIDEEERTIQATLSLAKKQIATKKLQNPVMQLRLCCDHPYNFFNPYLNPDLTVSEPDESIVTSSGKMLILDTLLAELFKDGHKVLIFSQFKTQLDILEDYASMRGWICCRIDGSIPQSERAAAIDRFNKPAKKQDAANLFLLSTRAGGQGINLVAADTVILFDSDWNPQQDLQAQDRAHRIGQTRNVLVYRFATRGTVEQGLLEKAEGKRRLEKLVIRKGGVKDVAANQDTMDELQKLLKRSDGEKWEIEDGKVISARDLAILTDRSDEAYERAVRGLDAGTAFQSVAAPGAGLLEKLSAS